MWKLSLSVKGSWSQSLNPTSRVCPKLALSMSGRETGLVHHRSPAGEQPSCPQPSGGNLCMREHVSVPRCAFYVFTRVSVYVCVFVCISVCYVDLCA
jgi:hypothetical protein